MAEGPSAPFGRGRVRRLFGLDRSGPPPRQTQKGAPLKPWTIPNFVGYARLAAIPLFLYLAFESGDGRSAAWYAVKRPMTPPPMTTRSLGNGAQLLGVGHRVAAQRALGLLDGLD